MEVDKMKRKAISKQLKDKLLVLSKHACMICRAPYTISHHIESISEGGGNEWMNLIILCPNCHHRVHVTKEIKESQLRIYRQKAEEGNLEPLIRETKIIPFPLPQRPLVKIHGQKAESITNIAAQNIENIKVITKGKPLVKIAPSPDSIGSDPLLKQAMITRFNRLGEEREKRFGKNAYTVMYNKFKRDFGIKNNKWTIIWTWPKECAQTIIEYLEEKFSKTIQGRIEKAANREGYLHQRKYLYKREKELLEHFGLSLGSIEIKKLLSDYFGVQSHTQLSHLQHWQWVCYLEGEAKKIEE
jgi:hypothetical protein